MADSACNRLAILSPTLSCTSSSLQKDVAVSHIASAASCCISDPLRLVKYPEALMKVRIPNSLNRSRFDAGVA